MYFLVSSLKLLFFSLTLILICLPSGNLLKLFDCMNNGTLKIEGSKQHCVCPSPFTGRLCEDFACVNGLSTGSQFDPESKFFNKRCLCDPGWAGELCDKSLIDRCGENGEEKNGKCLCQSDFSGDRCEYVTKCINGQLYNGRCACHYGWAGDFCDKIICHQGVADENNEACICPAKYRGKYCDFCAEPSNSPPPEFAKTDGRRPLTDEDMRDIHSITLAAVITLALAIIGTSLYLLFYKVNQRKRLKMARQNIADLDQRVPELVNEMAPHNSCSANGNALKNDLERFHYAPPPPPYKSVVHTINNEFVKSNEPRDSGIESSASSAQNTYLNERDSQSNDQ